MPAAREKGYKGWIRVKDKFGGQTWQRADRTHGDPDHHPSRGGWRPTDGPSSDRDNVWVSYDDDGDDFRWGNGHQRLRRSISPRRPRRRSPSPTRHRSRQEHGVRRPASPVRQRPGYELSAAQRNVQEAAAELDEVEFYLSEANASGDGAAVAALGGMVGAAREQLAEAKVAMMDLEAREAAAAVQAVEARAAAGDFVAGSEVEAARQKHRNAVVMLGNALGHETMAMAPSPPPAAGLVHHHHPPPAGVEVEHLRAALAASEADSIMAKSALQMAATDSARGACDLTDVNGF